MPTKLEANASFRKPCLVFLVLALALIFCVVFVGGVSGADVWDGGYDIGWYSEDETQFIITTAKDLAGLAKIVNGEIDGVSDDFSEDTIYLGDDIDLNNLPWASIGDSSDNPFRGTFNGGKKTIDNVHIDYNAQSIAGLFGYVDGGSICDLSIVDIYFDQVSNSGQKDAIIGSIAGQIHNGFISNCAVIGGVSFSTGTGGEDHYEIGGLIGRITADKVTITETNIGDYLKGHCFVNVLKTNYGKPYGLLVGDPLVGSLPNNGGSGGTGDVGSAIYKVHYYTMLSGGGYSNPITKTYVGVVGLEAGVDPAQEGWFISSQTPAPGTDEVKVRADGTLEVTVYYDILSYVVDIPPSIAIPEGSPVNFYISVYDLRIPSTSAVKVYIDGDFKLDYQNGIGVDPLNYEVRVGNLLLSKGDFVGQFTMSAHNPLQITATVLEPASYAGTYSDTVTFTYGLETTA